MNPGKKPELENGKLEVELPGVELPTLFDGQKHASPWLMQTVTESVITTAGKTGMHVDPVDAQNTSGRGPVVGRLGAIDAIISAVVSGPPGTVSVGNRAQFDEKLMGKERVGEGVNADPATDTKNAEAEAHNRSHLPRRPIAGSLTIKEKVNGTTAVVSGTTDPAESKPANEVASGPVKLLVRRVVRDATVAAPVRAVRRVTKAAAPTMVPVQVEIGVRASAIKIPAIESSIDIGRAPTTPLYERVCEIVPVTAAEFFKERTNTELTTGVEEVTVPGTAPTIGRSPIVMSGEGLIGAGKPVMAVAVSTPAAQVNETVEAVVTPATVEVSVSETVGALQVPPMTKIAVPVAPATVPTSVDAEKTVERGIVMAVVSVPKMGTMGLATSAVVLIGKSGHSGSQ